MVATKSDTESKEWDCHRLGFCTVSLVVEVVLIILFSLFVAYSDEAKSTNATAEAELGTHYPFFQDVNVMVFVGFGFLMTFLHKYGFSAVGYNFVISAFAIQMAILCTGLFERVYENSAEGPHPGHGFDEPLELSIVGMIKSLFAAAAVLISFGACLGKTTPTQLVVMTLFEIFFFSVNEMIAVFHFKAVDMGGSMVVHTFGAYFGLAVSRTISKSNVVPATSTEPKHEIAHKNDESKKTTDMFAMIGTLFLWMFWPSFNGALASDAQQQRVAINTFLSLAACACSAFIADSLMRPHHKFDMVSIQNATLAGGVAVGSAADLVIQPWGALLIGFIAGIISVVGYVYITPFLSKHMGLHDTCGVHNLHGMPGIMGGIAGAVSASMASPVSESGLYASDDRIASIFPARAPCQGNWTQANFNAAPCGLNASEQAAQQVLALVVTVAIAIVAGIITGFIIKMPCFLPPGHSWAQWCKCGDGLKRDYWFDDVHYWEVPSDDEEDDSEVDEEGVKGTQVEDGKETVIELAEVNTAENDEAENTDTQ
eukprot:CAMPEP_0195529264 /NCGR_PEP_ID=MMETSP0794_2-20130614/31737_1 /TAXON_ID=515487 /ORGANISM="Stephanopyxis turris, Strain CCMP 815" /LENGTH=540 /DNA_ID=CAMNT_0040660545 /DNA_START=51 /DNA_END=1673 /DNA_ORIENTATION=-